MTATSALCLVRDSFSPSRDSLLSPALDTLMMGGASIAFLLFFFLAIPYGDNAIYTVAVVALFIFYFINAPHFAASYQIAYGGFVRRIFGGGESAGMVARYLWMGVAVPALILGYIAFAFLHEKETALRYFGYLVNLLIFAVGWHYIKQVYGCIVVTSALRKIYYSPGERSALLAPLYALWLATYAFNNLGVVVEDFYGVPYHVLNLDALALGLFGAAEMTLPWPLRVFGAGPTVNILAFCGYSVIVAATVWALWVMKRKFRRERRLPPAAAAVAFVSIYVWLVPVFHNPYMVYLIPAFHSLQYLPFVLARQRNAALAALRDRLSERALEREERAAARTVNRLAFWALGAIPCVLVLFAALAAPVFSRLQEYFHGALQAPGSPLGLSVVVMVASAIAYILGRKLLSMQQPVVQQVCRFFLAAIGLGFAGFYGLPALLGYFVPLGEQYSGWFFLFLFQALINLHHYFIDNVIWKKNNRPVVHYLFSTRPLEAVLPPRAPSLQSARI